MYLCPECPKFFADWKEAVSDYSRRSTVYAATATATDSERLEEEAARIEGARMRAEVARAALDTHIAGHVAKQAGDLQEHPDSRRWD